jgi:Cu-processing system permease protein
VDKVWNIAWNTFMESVRDKVLYTLALMGGALCLIAVFLGSWSVHEKNYVIHSFNFSAITFSAFLLAVFIGIGLVQKELQKRTVLTLLSRPINRFQFLLGKYFGLTGVIAVHLGVMSLFFLLSLWLGDVPVKPLFLVGLFYTALEMLLVIAWTFLFSSFSTPILSAFWTLMVYISGRLSSEIFDHMRYALGSGEFSSTTTYLIENSLAVLYWVVPDFSIYHVQDRIIHDLPLGSGYFSMTLLYTIGYITVLMTASWLIFRKREFV